MARPLLFIGDIHLGRRPVGLDAPLVEAGLNARDLSAAAGWRLAVQHAIDQQVRAVLLAGDVVDHEKDRFEAYGQLERGVRDLRQAGIPVIAVAGNHDGLVLPRLVRAIEGVTLLGGNGAWTRHALEDDGPLVDVVGWSFPQRVVREDPWRIRAWGR
ncbi:MAG: metallophosphoesterase family protein [Myxococcota bacterium]